MDKQTEKNILEMVYESNRLSNLKESESPDFLVSNIGEEIPFGVEVTELFIDESNARLKKVPNYLFDLLDNEAFIHKDDKEVFDVSELSIIDKNNRVVSKQMGLTRKKTLHKDYIYKLIHTIEQKNSRIDVYLRGVSHVNLIILDQENFLYSHNAEDLFERLVTPQLRRAVLSSKFREVFLITVIDEDRRVFIPFRMNIYFHLYFFLKSFLIDKYPRVRPRIVRGYLRLFAEVLFILGEKVYISDNGNEIIWGNYGIKIDRVQGTQIRDHADYDLGKNVREMRTIRNKKIISKSFAKKYLEYCNKMMVKPGIVFDVRKEIEL